jgi:hypothetical protein
MHNSKKIIQKGGIITQVNITTKNNIKKILESGELVFCDLRQPHFRLNGIANFTLGIPIIIVKKKNGFNQPSNYYAIKMPEPTIKSQEPAIIIPEPTIKSQEPTIIADGLGKKEFYDNLIKKKSNSSNENKIYATKILIFFKLNWGNYPPFSEDFYDLNEYFISQTS